MLFQTCMTFCSHFSHPLNEIQSFPQHRVKVVIKILNTLIAITYLDTFNLVRLDIENGPSSDWLICCVINIMLDMMQRSLSLFVIEILRYKVSQFHRDFIRYCMLPAPVSPKHLSHYHANHFRLAQFRLTSGILLGVANWRIVAVAFLNTYKIAINIKFHKKFKHVIFCK